MNYSNFSSDNNQSLFDLFTSRAPCLPEENNSASALNFLPKFFSEHSSVTNITDKQNIPCAVAYETFQRTTLGDDYSTTCKVTEKTCGSNVTEIYSNCYQKPINNNNNNNSPEGTNQLVLGNQFENSSHIVSERSTMYINADEDTAATCNVTQYSDGKKVYSNCRQDSLANHITENNEMPNSDQDNNNSPEDTNQIKDEINNEDVSTSALASITEYASNNPLGTALMIGGTFLAGFGLYKLCNRLFKKEETPTTKTKETRTLQDIRIKELSEIASNVKTQSSAVLASNIENSKKRKRNDNDTDFANKNIKLG